MAQSSMRKTTIALLLTAHSERLKRVITCSPSRSSPAALRPARLHRTCRPSPVSLGQPVDAGGDDFLSGRQAAADDDGIGAELEELDRPAMHRPVFGYDPDLRPITRLQQGVRRDADHL